MDTAATDYESEVLNSLKNCDYDEDENSVFFFAVPNKKKDDENGVVVDIEAKGELESIASSTGVERIEIFARFYS
jgi:hypothetical protein